MTLKVWADNGWLQEHQLSREEAIDLLALADRDIDVAASLGQYTDWQFNIAYTAILSLAKLALALVGYRPGRTAHHYYLIHSLEFTVGIDDATVALLDSFRSRRHELTYVHAGVVSEGDAREILQVALRLREDVRKLVEQKRPDFI